MGFLAIILSSLALLAVIANTVLMIRERKRNQKRNTAQMNYVDESIRPIGEQFGKLDARIKGLESGVVPGFDERIKKLENGIVPDFEKAKEAANAVNEFNTGITGILGYDPYSALRRAREDGNGGEDT